MFRRRILPTCRASALICLWMLLLQELRADGSVSFHPDGSIVRNDTANVLNGSDDITICLWVFPIENSEANDKTVVALDETGTGLLIQGGSSTSFSFVAKWSTDDAVWDFPVSANMWSAVAIKYNKSDDDNDQVARVNFADVTESSVTPVGTPPTVNTGYAIGNLADAQSGWEGRIAYVQIFNRALSADEMDACLRAPGSVPNGLRIWLPMTNRIDINDLSGNGFDPTTARLGTGVDGPALVRLVGTPPRGIAVVRSGITNIDQFLIPRFGNGTTYPSGELVGHGTSSVIRGTGSTGTLPMSRRAVVVTEDYDYPNSIDYWQSGAFATLSGSISSISGGTPITVTTSANHGRSSGESITISGAEDFAAANGTFVITVTSTTTFTLNNTSTGGSDDEGTWAFFGLPITGSISSVSSGGPPVTVTTNAPHGFTDAHDGHFMTITGVTGAGTDINATHAINVTGTNTFTVQVTTSGTGSGGKWSYGQNPAVLRAGLRNLSIFGYPETTGTPPYNDPAGDSYTGIGIINSEPAIWHKTAGRIASISGDGTITVNSPGHTLVTGKTVMITGLGGFTLTSGPGPYTVTAPDANTFTFSADSDNGTHTPNTGVWTSTNSWPDREHGALLRSSGARVENVNFFYIPGTCLTLQTGHSPLNRKGRVLPFDSEKARVWNCQFSRAYRGAEIAIVDAIVGNVTGFDLRDYGIKFGRTLVEGGGGGSTQIAGALHFYGVGIGGIDQPAVWFANGGGGCWGGPIYAENSPVGMRVESSGNKLTGFYSKRCFLRNLWITGQRNSIENFEIDEIADGITENSGGEALLIGASGNMLSKGTFGGISAVPAGEIAIRVKGSNAGERMVIRDVSFLGTDGSSAPLISVEEQLQYARLDAIAWCDSNPNTQETFVDLFGVGVDRIGFGNVIFITAQNYFTPVKLDPTGWDKDNNLIVANGVRVLGSITGATNANPIVITSAGHELRDGEKVTIAAVQGNTNANGSYYVNVLSSSTFQLFTDEGLTTGRAGNAGYTADTGYFGKRFNSVDVAAD